MDIKVIHTELRPLSDRPFDEFYFETNIDGKRWQHVVPIAHPSLATAEYAEDLLRRTHKPNQTSGVGWPE